MTNKTAKSERSKMTNKLRFSILQRDNFTCQYCGDSKIHNGDDVELEVDHILPVSKGGKTEIANLITACRECNQGKKDEIVSIKGRQPIQTTRGATFWDFILYILRRIEMKKGRGNQTTLRYPPIDDIPDEIKCIKKNFYILGLDKDEDFKRGLIDEIGLRIPDKEIDPELYYTYLKRREYELDDNPQ